MLGAIIGDIVGSTREWNNVKTEDFELLPSGSHFTDDSVMTLAVAEWLMRDSKHKKETLIECMQTLGRKYPNAGYGGMFRKWLASENPKPYGSFGNGSAMRVSPVGMYAESLDEAIKLARITAEVTHDHPEGIKGAQAIAACVYLKKHELKQEIKPFVKRTFGYNLDINLEDIRDEYTFDVTCQGSVPVAIMAYLQRDMYPAENALRLAISMGGDSDTIGCMTCAIATAEPFYISGAGMPSEVETRCKELLPSDLLDIQDRFEAFISRPLYQSFEVRGNGIFFAGEYPGDKYEAKAEDKIRHMAHFGIRHFVDLTEENELKAYRHLLPDYCTYDRFPIKDVSTPKSVEEVYKMLHRLDELKQTGEYVYLHSRSGVGRTGTVAACYLARVLDNPTIDHVLQVLRNQFAMMPKSAHRVTPETPQQINFIKQFIESLSTEEKEEKRIHDCIRGSLMAGAMGDALGYTVEFMSRHAILHKYGGNGITQFDLDSNGKALVSDDTQMTLFTANGMLMGITRGFMRGIGGAPEKYVNNAYVDWYYTQTGYKKDDYGDDFHVTWLRDLPELAHQRAPGNTCLNACKSMARGVEVTNNSKGCGGIMRVAPMALLAAGYRGRNTRFYLTDKLAEAGAEIAMATHKHPLGFLPAAMLTHLLSVLVPLSVEEAKERITSITEETIRMLDRIFVGKYNEEKEYLAKLTRKAFDLSHSKVDDASAIGMLGQGWTGEEAWAIAFFCSIRHIDSVKEAIIASVNHDGDSDSTGSVTGNIMGAIHGYETIKRQRLFCPKGRELEDTLELSNIILTIADDLSTSCIISEYDPIDTAEKKIWYQRYCEMKPVGIK